MSAPSGFHLFPLFFHYINPFRPFNNHLFFLSLHCWVALNVINFAWFSQLLIPSSLSTLSHAPPAPVPAPALYCSTLQRLFSWSLLETSKEELQYYGVHHKYKINRSLRVLSLLSFFGFSFLSFFFLFFFLTLQDFLILVLRFVRFLFFFWFFVFIFILIDPPIFLFCLYSSWALLE